MKIKEELDDNQNDNVRRKPKRRKLDMYEILVCIVLVYLAYMFFTGGVRGHQEMKEAYERSSAPK